MEHIQAECDDNLLILTMARGKANALNQLMVEELYTAVNSAAADDSVRGLVLASDWPRFFSTGFDIREVFTYDRDGMAAFFGRLSIFTKAYTPAPSRWWRRSAGTLSRAARSWPSPATSA